MSFRKIIFPLLIFFLSLSQGLSEPIPKYDRDLFGGWADFDGDCQNTRHELLQKLSTSIVVLNKRQCRVLTGLWYDPYSDKFFTQSSDLDIDHLVPLFYAWDKGAYLWEFEKRRRFANDSRNLFAVEKRINREKSASGPTDWLPPNLRFRCQYILRFQQIVKMYELEQKNPEATAIARLQDFYC